MAIGDIRIIDGEEFEVVWSGGEGLVSDRTTKTTGIWTPPKRLYNKKSDFWTKPRGKNAPEEPVGEPPNIDHFGEEEANDVQETS